MKTRTPKEEPAPSLSLEISDSPHWTLQRARAERDRLAAQLDAITGQRCEAEIEWLTFHPSPEAKAAVGSFVHRNTRGKNRLRRFYIFAAYVVAIESRFTPPPRKSCS